MLHDTTIDVPSGIEHHPSGPDAPNAPHAPETRARRLLLAAAKRDQPPFAPVPAWWRGSRDATLHLVHLPNADALGTLRDALDDAGEIAGYVPSSAYLVVVRDNAVLAELLPKVPGAWTTELKPHHKISPNLLLIDDGIDDVDTDASLFKDVNPEHHVAAYPPPVDGVDAAVIAADAEAAIRLLGLDAKVETASTGAVLVSGNVTAALIGALASRPWTHWIERRRTRRHVATRNRFTSAVIQTGRGENIEEPLEDAVSRYTANPRARGGWGVHPVWRAGIRGEGVLVGVGDSGLDVRSCWLADPEMDEPGPRHRKIQRYNALWGDDVDGNGHGTHVVSTILGEAVAGSPNGASEYDGMAPRARVHFNDIGVGTGGSLFLPTSIADYFDSAYKDGARIHSDSWGNDAPLYDGLAREVDEYTWSHPDFLPIFAAGNFGMSAGAPSTVTSPSTCKNGLAVGASLGWSGPAVVPSTVGDSATMLVRTRAGAGANPERGFTVYMAAMGASRFVFNAEPKPLIAADPMDACSDLIDGRVYAGTIVLVTRGGCYFSDKILRVQNAGAAGVLVANDDVTGFFKMGPKNDGDERADSIRVPAASVPRSSHLALLAAMPCVVTFSPAEVSRRRVDHVASFSSFGPTEDGRIKPDLVAPGEITSSAGRLDGNIDPRSMHCSVTTIAGTSMATPVVAGAAALIRQYFTDGFYPSGARNQRDGFAPTAALIKAALINGCEPMNGFTETGLPLEPPPSVRQGHGRVHVGRSLPLGSNGSSRMWIVDDGRVEHGATFSFCLETKNSDLPDSPDGPAGDAELRVTLVWTDPPAALPAGGPALVNDLDLTVTRSGDQASTSGESASGNFRDDMNNVERVVVELGGGRGESGAGGFIVRVIGRNVRWVPGGTRGQPYALVATAPGLAGAPC